MPIMTTGNTSHIIDKMKIKATNHKSNLDLTCVEKVDSAYRKIQAYTSSGGGGRNSIIVVVVVVVVVDST